MRKPIRNRLLQGLFLLIGIAMVITLSISSSLVPAERNRNEKIKKNVESITRQQLRYQLENTALKIQKEIDLFLENNPGTDCETFIRENEEFIMELGLKYIAPAKIFSNKSKYMLLDLTDEKVLSDYKNVIIKKGDDGVYKAFNSVDSEDMNEFLDHITHYYGASSPEDKWEIEDNSGEKFAVEFVTIPLEPGVGFNDKPLAIGGNPKDDTLKMGLVGFFDMDGLIDNLELSDQNSDFSTSLYTISVLLMLILVCIFIITVFNFKFKDED